MLPDEPLGAVPVEALSGVSDPRKMHACFVGGKRFNGLLVAEIIEGKKTSFVIVNKITVYYRLLTPIGRFSQPGLNQFNFNCFFI